MLLLERMKMQCITCNFPHRCLAIALVYNSSAMVSSATRIIPPRSARCYSSSTTDLSSPQVSALPGAWQGYTISKKCIKRWWNNFLNKEKLWVFCCTLNKICLNPSKLSTWIKNIYRVMGVHATLTKYIHKTHITTRRKFAHNCLVIGSLRVVFLQSADTRPIFYFLYIVLDSVQLYARPWRRCTALTCLNKLTPSCTSAWTYTLVMWTLTCTPPSTRCVSLNTIVPIVSLEGRWK